ncbi:MAG: universal stress protein [Magnetococcales bacterium]|nr:universal stress protein [Magnetococcales bacterium]NGZ28745.1 universal stress protein [Magnetococcales bacterium]
MTHEHTSHFKNILLTTDGSEFSMGTERVGIDLAQQNDAQLYVLRLLMHNPDSPEGIADQEEAAAQMDRIGALCVSKGVKCNILLRQTVEPSQGILSVAKEVDADVVVVGRRGKRGIARMMVGDATTKIIEKSECTVLVVPRLVSVWDSHILLAIEPESQGDDPAEAAIDLAQASHLPLTVLMVTDEKENDQEQREIYQSVNRLVAKAKLENIEADGLVMGGDMDKLILEVARQRSADLIICEPRDRSMIDKLFNTNNIVHLIGQAHCPVMVVK